MTAWIVVRYADDYEPSVTYYTDKKQASEAWEMWKRDSIHYNNPDLERGFFAEVIEETKGE